MLDSCRRAEQPQSRKPTESPEFGVTPRRFNTLIFKAAVCERLWLCDAHISGEQRGPALMQERKPLSLYIKESVDDQSGFLVAGADI